MAAKASESLEEVMVTLSRETLEELSSETTGGPTMIPVLEGPVGPVGTQGSGVMTQGRLQHFTACQVI